MDQAEIDARVAAMRLNPHLAYVPMVADDGEVHRGSVRCQCHRDRSHRASNWNALLAEQHEILQTRDQ